jgi:hypothetical protein
MPGTRSFVNFATKRPDVPVRCGSKRNVPGSNPTAEAVTSNGIEASGK